MAGVQLKYTAEKNAQKALKYEFCQGLKLETVKDFVQSTLAKIGRNGIFAEYTMHDISHVNGVLQLLDKIIPDKTKKIMTDADWLMIVLSVYFHDLGMYIPDQEFENRRSNEEFLVFEEEMRRYPSVMTYLSSLDDDKQSRFIYQEYVRKNHGARVAEWIKNCDKKPGEPYELIRDKIGMLDALSRTMLAEICRSHQLNELPEFLQSADRSLGPSAQEKVNLLYVSVLLRSADLLHITQDRTPNVEFRLISPRNEISIMEWQKQKAVRSLEIRYERKSGGRMDDSVQPHAFEIQAEFEKAECYFAFASYVNYAISELEKCHAWCEESRDKNQNGYLFPWDDIDISRVEATGFYREKLRFQIDQESILRLLTGKTLYNDTTVVLRELIQNAIDAGRAQHASEKSSTSYRNRVLIQWNTKTRELSISDNGIGMTEADVKNYLLRVGASKYQSESFKKDYPNFHSISRFGIGLLTCFMISDEVDVYTLASKESRCLHLMIRKLTGDYLMRDDEDKSHIYEERHGSKFVLKVRPEVNMENLKSQIQQWIILPHGEVTLEIDGQDPVEIGYKSTESAVSEFCIHRDVKIDGEKYKITTIQDQTIGMTMSCLMHKNPYTQIWSIWNLRNREGSKLFSSGICVEGIRVTNAVPGFDGEDAIVLVNFVGKNAPTTNVARNDIESGESLDKIYHCIYKQYMKICMDQYSVLQKNNSAIWALNEINYKIDEFCDNIHHSSMLRRSILQDTLKTIQCSILDDGNQITPKSLEDFPDVLYVVDSLSYTSSVNLLIDVKTMYKTPLALFSELTKETFEGMPVLLENCLSRNVLRLFQKMYEPDKIEINDELHCIKVRWRRDTKLWHIVDFSERYYRYHSYTDKSIYVLRNISGVSIISGEKNNTIICTSERYFILPGSKLYEYLIDNVFVEGYDIDDVARLLDFLKECIGTHSIENDQVNRLFRNEELQMEGTNKIIRKSEFLKVIQDSMDDILNYSYYYHYL